jgi:hypothetical protein
VRADVGPHRAAIEEPNQEHALETGIVIAVMLDLEKAPKGRCVTRAGAGNRPREA